MARNKFNIKLFCSRGAARYGSSFKALDVEEGVASCDVWSITLLSHSSVIFGFQIWVTNAH